jgi:hypothetical protein
VVVAKIGENSRGYYFLVVAKRDTGRFEGLDRVELRLPDGQVASVDIAPSFWRDCPDLRSRELHAWLTDWLRARYRAVDLNRDPRPWPDRHPDAFDLVARGAGVFEVVERA